MDIVEGTLIGCPASLRFMLQGLVRLRGSLEALDQLASLGPQGGFTPLSREA